MSPNNVRCFWHICTTKKKPSDYRLIARGLYTIGFSAIRGRDQVELFVFISLICFKNYVPVELFRLRHYGFHPRVVLVEKAVPRKPAEPLPVTHDVDRRPVPGTAFDIHHDKL